MIVVRGQLMTTVACRWFGKTPFVRVCMTRAPALAMYTFLVQTTPTHSQGRLKELKGSNNGIEGPYIHGAA